MGLTRSEVSFVRRIASFALASVLQTNHPPQVQWKNRPAPVLDELRGSGSFYGGKWNRLSQVFRDRGGRRCTGLVLNPQTRFNLFMGKPPRQDFGEFLGFHHRITDFHRPIPVPARSRGSPARLLSKIYANQNKGTWRAGGSHHWDSH